MTSQKQKNDDSPKGFAGLASMLSNVDDVTTPNETQKPKPLEKTAVDANKPNASIPSQQTSKNSSKTKNWIVVLGIILGLIWLMSESDHKSIAPQFRVNKQETNVSIEEINQNKSSNGITAKGMRVQLPSGQVLKFPEEATREEVLNYIDTKYPEFKPQEKNPPIGEIGKTLTKIPQIKVNALTNNSQKKVTYEITLPDGTYTVEGPEGATKEKIIEFIELQNQSEKNTSTPSIGGKVSGVVEDTKKSIAPNDLNLLSDAKTMVISMIDYALIDGGLKNESEIQKTQKRITALPKPTKTNIKEARDFNNNGLALVKEENYNDAVKLFENGNRLNPADVEIVNNLGFAYVKQNQLDSAQQAMITSLAMAPNRAIAWANLGDVYALKNDKSRAVACLANAYRFSRNREKTHQFFKSLNEKENVEQLKQARNEAISWAEKTYFAVSTEEKNQNLWGVYKDTETGFKINYPSSWILQSVPVKAQKTKFMVFSKIGDGGDGSCDVAVIPNDFFLNMSQEDINHKLEALPDSDQPWSKLLPPEVNVKQIESHKFMKSNMLIYWATVEMTSTNLEEKWTIKQINTLTFTPGFIWAIHCGVSNDDASQTRARFTELQTVFNDVLGSFTFVKH